MPDQERTGIQQVAAAVRSPDGFAIASMILGLVTVLTFWAFPVCALFAGAAFATGRLAQLRLRQLGKEKSAARGWATAGIALSLSGFMLSATIFASCRYFVNKTGEAGQEEFGKAIHELEQDPEFKRQLEELRQDLKTLDEKPAEDKEKDDGDDEPPPDKDKDKH